MSQTKYYQLTDFPEFAMVETASLNQAHQLIYYQSPYKLQPLLNSELSQYEYYLINTEEQIYIEKAGERWEILKTSFKMGDFLNGNKTSFLIAWPTVIEHLVEDSFGN